MTMKFIHKALLFALPISCTLAPVLAADGLPPPGVVVSGHAVEGTATTPIPSGIVSWQSALREVSPWGEFRKAYVGESFGMKDMLIAHAVIKPGMVIHEPHQHAEEQFSVLVDGEGTWEIDGKLVPAKKGDVMYCAPWIKHTIRNTSKKPMTFLVVKVASKGVPTPAKPKS
jgi:mannose-6-phosphate isomerase-like protein (cupin superfamily)